MILKSIQANNSKASKLRVAWVFFVWVDTYSMAGRGGVFQKDPSQGGDTMGEEEAKTSKPIGEIVAFENEPS